MNLFGLHTNHRQKGFSLIVDIIYFPQISLFKSNSLPSITQNVQKMKRKKHHELWDSWICLAKVYVHLNVLDSPEFGTTVFWRWLDFITEILACSKSIVNFAENWINVIKSCSLPCHFIREILTHSNSINVSLTLPSLRNIINALLTSGNSFY